MLYCHLIKVCHLLLFRTVNVDGKQELRAVATRSPSTEVSQSSGASAASTSSTAVNNSATANSSVINPNKYKTMHCRNFSTKGIMQLIVNNNDNSSLPHIYTH